MQQPSLIVGTKLVHCSANFTELIKQAEIPESPKICPLSSTVAKTEFFNSSVLPSKIRVQNCYIVFQIRKKLLRFGSTYRQSDGCSNNIILVCTIRTVDYRENCHLCHSSGAKRITSDFDCRFFSDFSVLRS